MNESLILNHKFQTCHSLNIVRSHPTNQMKASVLQMYTKHLGQGRVQRQENHRLPDLIIKVIVFVYQRDLISFNNSTFLKTFNLGFKLIK